MIVMKFGGTSVGDADRILNAAKIVKSYLAQNPLVVISAMAGVTDTLIKIAVEASKGNKEIIRKDTLELLEKHETVAKKLLKEPDNVLYLINDSIDKLKTLYESIFVLGELTKRSLDLIMSYGEKLSSLVFAAVLDELEVKAEQVVTDEIVITDDTFGSAQVDIGLTKMKVKAKLARIFEQKKIPVITGFIGGTKEGITTTVGRSGSDYSASIIGACIGVDEVWIWTDVDGVMTADPRLVSNAETINELSYREAAELSYFGAKVIHPKTMLPAIDNNIPLRIMNTFNPSGKGTVIKKAVKPNCKQIKGITSIKNLSLITVEGAAMMGVPGIAGKVFNTVASEGINVLMISQASSEHSICFVISKEDADKTVKALRKEFSNHIMLRNIETISVMNDITIVAVVGENMMGRPGIAGKLFNTLGKNNVNVMAIAQGSSELNISFVVTEKELNKAVTCIHEEFELGK